MPGECRICEEPMEGRKVPLLQQARPLPGGSELALQVAEGRQLGLKQIQEALRPLSVQVDSSKLVVAGPAELVVRGTGEKAMDSVQKSLIDAKLYSVARVSQHEDNTIRVRVDGGGATTHKTVEGALGGVGATLVDVLWTGVKARG
jgi:hypothetical protein